MPWALNAGREEVRPCGPLMLIPGACSARVCRWALGWGEAKGTSVWG